MYRLQCSQDLKITEKLGIRMRSGPHAKSMHLRRGRPSCVRACHIPDHDGHVHTYVRTS